MNLRDTKDFNNTRNLSEVFEELQRSRYEHIMNNNRKVRNINIRAYKNNNRKVRVKKQGISLVSIICGIIIVVISMSSTNLIFAANSNNEEEKIEFEENKQNVNVEQIISDNISSTERKELVTENREIEFSTKYVDNENLPKDEQVVVQEGTNGITTVTVVKSYENNSNSEKLLEENILNTTVVQAPVQKVVEVGTSELLGKFQVHIGDTMYTIGDVQLRETSDEKSNVLYTIGKYMDVVILGVENNTFKVKYETFEGYVNSKNLVSMYTNPEYAEKCRIQKILNKVNVDINVSEPSGLSLEDFKKVLSNNYRDTNKVFENNAEVFYNLEQKYQINGLVIAAIGIHESSWGTSAISLDKKNLFGYGAYDSDPYNSAVTFETYEEGIETVAKYLIKNYLNPAGTEIYDGETATGKYYNGNTIAAINIRYATDENWGTAVYNIMEGLYEKL